MGKRVAFVDGNGVGDTIARVEDTASDLLPTTVDLKAYFQ
jgi:hypothetical protein